MIITQSEQLGCVIVEINVQTDHIHFLIGELEINAYKTSTKRKSMSAISILYAGDQELPFWTKLDGEETEESELFESNYLIPILWFSLFSENNLGFFIDPDGESENPNDNKIPILVRSRNECIKALEERTKFILKIAANCNESITALCSKLIASKGHYISIDLAEPFFMVGDPEKFILDINNILKLFDEESPENIGSLLSLSCVEGYDLNINDFIPNMDYGYEYHAIGMSV